jgi:hypothetical protein
VQQHERTHGRSQLHPQTRPASDIRLLPAEAHLASPRVGSILEDPDLAGNPVALAHARATRKNHRATAGSGGHPIGTALLFLVVVPAIIFLVSNPLGWVLLLGLCFGFAYLFGFGGIL